MIVRRLVLLLWLMAGPLWAVEPSEILPDPAMEARARTISAELRCLVCRNESIDDSNAGLAKDLRLLVRERLVAGDTDEEVVAFVVARYGEYVLLKPKISGSNLVLWLAGPLMLVLALWLGWRTTRVRITKAAQPLDPDEQARLNSLLDK